MLHAWTVQHRRVGRIIKQDINGEAQPAAGLSMAFYHPIIIISHDFDENVEPKTANIDGDRLIVYYVWPVGRPSR